MTMDLISGLAVTAGVFMLAAALVAVASTRVGPKSPSGVHDASGLASRVLATIVVVFFITMADLLLIAQQVSLALGTFVIGILLVVLLYVEPSLRSGRREAVETKEDWRE